MENKVLFERGGTLAWTFGKNEGENGLHSDWGYTQGRLQGPNFRVLKKEARGSIEEA